MAVLINSSTRAGVGVRVRVRALPVWRLPGVGPLGEL